MIAPKNGALRQLIEMAVLTQTVMELQMKMTPSISTRHNGPMKMTMAMVMNPAASKLMIA